MRILMMEGNPKARRDKGDARGVPSSSAIYTRAIKAHFPDIEIDVVFAADPGPWLPAGKTFRDYAGMVVSGSSLHSYHATFEVTNQINMLKAACEAGLPVLGSCWGLQIAAVAAGGAVVLSPNGREVGVARKIGRTGAGQAHPFLAGKPNCFDAPCIHYDEVASLPGNCVVLASNSHSAIQAAIVPIANSEVWAVQYHPEFDLKQISMLYGLYAEDMLQQGFFADHADMESFRSKIDNLAAKPSDKALAWQLGIDSDITDDLVRRAEIIAWIKNLKP